MPKDSNDELTFYLDRTQLNLLKRFDFPLSDRVLASARSTEYGIELTGTRYQVETLCGFVAGEANHQRRGRAVRRTESLDEIADELESALASY